MALRFRDLLAFARNNVLATLPTILILGGLYVGLATSFKQDAAARDGCPAFEKCHTAVSEQAEGLTLPEIPPVWFTRVSEQSVTAPLAIFVYY